MIKSIFVHYSKSKIGVRITDVEDGLIIVAIAEYCRLLELRDFNRVVCSTEILYKVIQNYSKATNCECELTDSNCDACLVCEIQSDILKFGTEKDYFTNSRRLLVVSDVHKINESQPKELQFDKAYLDSQFHSYLFRF